MRNVKSVCSSNQDIISYLLSNIIENILICLPLRDAVRTSILSSNWRYKWVTLPQLVFDTWIRQEFSENPLSAKHVLRTTIYQVLLHHKGPILKFVMSNPDVKSFCDINQWILFLSNNDILDFTLQIWTDEPHKLPSHFYSFLQLRYLELWSCVFKPPPTFKGFSRLVSLDLNSVVLEAELFGSFISSCPLLEQLKLLTCTEFECLEIDAPNLKLLWFFGTLKTICFKNIPLLAIVLLGLGDTAENAEEPMEGETSNLIKFMAVGNVLKMLPITLNHLKSLDLGDVCFEKVDEISCALCFIGSSPNLQELRISVDTRANALMKPSVKFSQAQDYSDFSLNQLQVVKMQYISGVEPELEFIKYLLANSTVLEMMSIQPFKRNVTDRGLKMLEELTQFPRASARAEIEYL
ncbi:hypothetical protein L1049_006026 [Liquidambar formosana]|uniref:FBD domain-containing protein n=1 Tax=Liquidambar formosana TaxID=63359 RepID=A0AAP0REU3_LIQFO